NLLLRSPAHVRDPLHPRRRCRPVRGTDVRPRGHPGRAPATARLRGQSNHPAADRRVKGEPPVTTEERDRLQTLLTDLQHFLARPRERVIRNPNEFDWGVISGLRIALDGLRVILDEPAAP